MIRWLPLVIQPHHVLAPLSESIPMRVPALFVALACLALSAGPLETAFAQGLNINDRTLPEGNAGSGDVTLTVTLTSAAAGIVTVDYVAENLATPTATGGTTCNGTSDYIIETGTLEFAAGQVSRTVGIAVCGDVVVEGEEAFRVRLRNPSGATIQDAAGRVTLTNDDAAAPPPTLAINDVTAAEGNTGSTARQFAVTLSAAASQTVTVQFAFAATPANAAARGATCGAGIDVAFAASGTLTFAPSVTTQAIPLTVCGDVVDESDETFDVVLSNPTGATIADGSGRGTITDDDLPAPSVPSLSINDRTLTEGNTGTTAMNFTVTLSAASTQVVTVSAVTTAIGTTRLAGTTTCGVTTDLLGAGTRTLTFAPSVTTQTIPFTICGDVEDEIDEAFNVTLSNPTGATIADGSGRGTITDDDLPAAPGDLTVNVTKAGAVPTVPTGGGVAFVFTVANAGAAQVTNVLTRVSIPFAFTSLVPSAAAGTGITCDGVGRVVGSTEPHVLLCTATTVAANGQKDFRVSVTAPATITGATQSFTVTAQVDPEASISEGTAGEGNNSDNLAVQVATMADLSVSLTGTGGQSIANQLTPDLAYVVIAENKGDRDAPNVLVRSTLPKDVAFAGVEENTLGTCIQNSTAADGSLNVNCTLSSLPAGANRRARIVGRLLGTVPDNVQVTFAAAVDPNNTVPERNDTDNTAFAITTLRAPSDLQVTGEVSKSNISKIGPPIGACASCRATRADLQLRLVVRNNGPNPSPATLVRTEWPSREIFEATGPGTCTPTNDICSISVPGLNSGATFAIQGNAKWSADTHDPTTARITATVDPDAASFDRIVGNNTATISVTVP